MPDAPDIRSLAAAEQEIAELKATLAEQGAILEWIEAALRGEPVSDFAESFGPVMEARLLRAQVETLDAQAADLRRDNEALREAVLVAVGELAAMARRASRYRSRLARVLRLFGSIEGLRAYWTGFNGGGPVWKFAMHWERSFRGRVWSRTVPASGRKENR